MAVISITSGVTVDLSTASQEEIANARVALQEAERNAVAISAEATEVAAAAARKAANDARLASGR